MPSQLQQASLYFDPYDVDDISRAIDSLWSDPNLFLRLKKNGKIRLSQMSLSTFINSFHDIILD